MTVGQWFGAWLGDWFGSGETHPAGAMSGSATISFVATGTLEGVIIDPPVTQNLSGGSLGAAYAFIEQQETRKKIRHRRQSEEFALMAL